MAENKLQLPEISWPRVGDYLLGRSTLIGIASLMLLMISGYAIWQGMRDFIIGVSSTHSQEPQDGLSVSHGLLVVVVVVERLWQNASVSQGGNIVERQLQFEARAADIRGQARSIAAPATSSGSPLRLRCARWATRSQSRPAKQGFPATIQSYRND